MDAPSPDRKCEACLSVIDEEKFFKCSKCKNYFHLSCLGAAPVGKGTQVCPNCVRASRTSIRQETKASDTPSDLKASRVTGRSKQRQMASLNLDQALTESSETSTVLQELRYFRNEMSEVKNQLSELTNKVTKFQDKLDDLVDKISSHESRLKTLEQRDLEVLQLQSKVQELELAAQSREQASLKNELEISGMTECAGENLYHTILLTAKTIGTVLEERDIDWISRVGPKSPKTTAATTPTTEVNPEAPSTKGKYTRPVVVRFVRQTGRDEFLAAAKARRDTVTTIAIEIPGPSQKLYFNERLTHHQRQLFRETRQRARESGFKYCWTKNGQIYARQKEGRKCLHIKSRSDFENIRVYKDTIVTDVDTIPTV